MIAAAMLQRLAAGRVFRPACGSLRPAVWVARRAHVNRFRRRHEHPPAGASGYAEGVTRTIQDDLRVHRLGERSLHVEEPDPGRAHLLIDALVGAIGSGRVEDVVPGDGSILILFDGTDAGERTAIAALRDADRRSRDARWIASRSRPREFVIPVHYGGDDGPDLDEAAALAGCTPDDLVRRHAAGAYTVRFLGFAPGFPYIGDLPAELAVPRLDSPRTTTPTGSVAIAERYTGIYPAELPGGWRVIGRTPLTLFDPSKDPPALLLAGDRVRFEAI